MSGRLTAIHRGRAIGHGIDVCQGYDERRNTRYTRAHQGSGSPSQDL